MGRRGKQKFVPIGMFSEGTDRDEDVGNAIAGLLRPLYLNKADRQTVREWDAEQNLRHGGLAESTLERRKFPEPDDDVQSELCQELWTALDNYLMPYTYAGSAEGDGAYFGVWPSITSLEEDARNGDVLKVNNLTDVPRGHTGFVMEVNDHGNVTLYNATRGRLRSIWGVV